MIYEEFNIGGELVKQDQRYVVRDNKLLNNLVLSSTLLHPQKATSGHKHEGQEEVYIFMQGEGKIELIYPDKEGIVYDVKQGTTVLIEDGVFHRVRNTSLQEPLYFICVFDGARKH